MLTTFLWKTLWTTDIFSCVCMYSGECDLNPRLEKTNNYKRKDNTKQTTHGGTIFDHKENLKPALYFVLPYITELIVICLPFYKMHRRAYLLVLFSGHLDIVWCTWWLLEVIIECNNNVFVVLCLFDVCSLLTRHVSVEIGEIRWLYLLPNIK